MMESTPPSPIGSLILIGILMFIVYRILYSISGQQRPSKSGEAVGGKVFPLPGKRPPEPPATAKLVHYTGDKDPFGNRTDALEFHKTLVEKGGMNRIGDFTIEEMPGYTIRAFTRPDQSLVGIIYRDPSDRVWVNLITEYKDGRIITTSSAESEAISLSRPHGMPLFNFPDISIDQLLRRHKLETRGVERMPPIPPEEFPDYFARNYAKVRAHIYEQEQKSAETQSKTGAILSFPRSLGKSRYEGKTDKEEDIGEDEFVPTGSQRRQWLDMIYEAVSIPHEQRAQFQAGLVWIVDKAGAQSISRTISEYSDVMIEQAPEGRLIIRSEAGAEDIIEPGNLKGPELFEKINSGLPAKQKFTRLPVRLEGVTFYSKMTSEF